MRYMIFFFAIALVADELPWEAGYHGAELEYLRLFLPENPIILEAGAHNGEDTIPFIRQWPHATVHAFEPHLPCYSHLEKAASTYPNVHTYPFGLYSETGTYTFYVSQKIDGAFSLFEDNSPEIEYADTQVTIECKNLDEWAYEEGVDHIDYMWLDMEGAELAMLKSAPKMLQTVRAISTEVNFQEFRKGMARWREMREFLEENGFSLYKIWGDPKWQATAIFVR